MSARVRIALVITLLAAAATTIAYFVIAGLVTKRTLAQVDTSIGRQRKLFESLRRIEAVDAIGQTEKMAAEAAIVGVLKSQGEDQFRKCFEELEGQKVRFEERQQKAKDKGRKADFFALVNGEGKVICRDIDPNSMRDEDLKTRYPGVAAALAGEANRDIWNLGKTAAMYRVSVAPVRDGATVLGALAVGFVISTKDAEADGELLGADVVYYLDQRVFAASLADQEKTKELDKVLGQQITQLTAGGQEAAPIKFKLRGEAFIGVAAPFPAAKNRNAGVVLLASETRALEFLGLLRTGIFGGGTVMILLILAAWFTIVRHFMTPLDELELATTELINGKIETEYRVFTEEYEGLANALNVMVSKLTGRPEPGENPDDWVGDPLFIEDLDITTQSVIMAMGPDGRPQPVSMEQSALELSREPEAAYFSRIYREYVEARRRLNQDSMAFERFVEKTRENELELCKKYNCRMVRFQVMIRADNVTMRPVPIDPQP